MISFPCINSFTFYVLLHRIEDLKRYEIVVEEFFTMFLKTNLLNAFFRERESPGHGSGRRDVAYIVRHYQSVLTLQQSHQGL